MHPLVVTAKNDLGKLSILHRGIALAACDPECSDADYLKFDRLWMTADRTLRSRLFPVFLVIFDPARIPPAAEIEDPSPTTKNQLRHLLWLLAHKPKELPEGVFDICAFFIAWMDFLYTFQDFLVPLKDVVVLGNRTTLPPKPGLLVSLVRWGRDVELKWGQKLGFDPVRINENLGPTKVFWTSPVYLRRLVDAWLWIVEQPKLDVILLFDCIGMFPYILDQAQLDALLEAAGTVDNLVRLVKRHLTLVGAIPPQSRIDGAIALSCRPLEILAQADKLLVAANPNNPITAVATSLVSHHIFPQVIEVLNNTVLHPKTAAVAADHRDHEYWLRSFRSVIGVTNIIVGVGPRPLRMALRHDIIPLLLRAVLHMHDGPLKSNLRRLLEIHIPSGASYTSMLPLVTELITTVEASPLARVLNHSEYELAPVWAHLKSSASFYNEVSDSLAQSDRLAACDNPPCGRIDKRERFRRCSGCAFRMYCSSACQKTDWRTGDHRSTCSATRAEYAKVRALFSKRQLALFRLALDTFYRENAGAFHCISAVHRRAIGKEQATAGHDPRAVIIATTSFLGGKPELNDVLIEPALTNQEHMHLPNIDDWISRARRSNGRLAIHVVTLPVGVDRYSLVCPLRMNMSVLEDFALRIAHSAPPLDEQTQGSIRTMRRTFAACVPPSELLVVHQ
ncbi:MYND-type domain-containing protein [Mycena indigotica]|uniref:MYND-type domain-containing protein n=1 Tax=Mycena indigotica TaxID=2126181 RepID=A0A8H6S886_9AGAR|nr:MYND-type domain-containing protein [Mycena indigotica]KAF7293095.1 MYND-type domain-containing protein [Mycena indigotica]